MERVLKPLEGSFRVLCCLFQRLQRPMLFFSDILSIFTGIFKFVQDCPAVDCKLPGALRALAGMVRASKTPATVA